MRNISTKALLLAASSLICSDSLFAALTVTHAGNGNLSVTGTAAAESFRIVDNRLGGLAVIGYGGTSVNGVVNGFFTTAAAPVADVIVSTLGGADSITVRFSNADGNLRINSGGGGDTISLIKCEILGLAYLNGSGGPDFIQLIGSEVDALTIIGGDGASDYIALSQSAVFGNTNITAETGDPLLPPDLMNFEYVEAVRSEFYGTVRVTTGNGADTVVLDQSELLGSLFVKTNPGNDGVRIEQCGVAGTFRIDLGHGADKAISANSDHLGNAVVVCGAGNDTVAKLGSTFDSNVTVVGGAGNDKILTVAARFGTLPSHDLRVLGQGNNDTIFALANIFNAGVLLNGGGGFDDLSGESNLYNSTYSDAAFEGILEPDWLLCIEDLLAIGAF